MGFLNVCIKLCEVIPACAQFHAIYYERTVFRAQRCNLGTGMGQKRLFCTAVFLL